MAKVNVVLFKSKKLKNGEHPIMIDVSHESKRKYFPLNNSELKSNITGWDADQRLIKSNRKNRERVDKLNTEILKQKQHILDIINDFERQRVTWTLNMLAEARERKPKTALFCEIFQKYINSQELITTRNTSIYYRSSLIKFCTKEVYEKLTCSEIDYSFINKFYDYLRTKNETGLSPETIRTHFKVINGVLNLAIREKVSSEATQPFKKKDNGKYFDLQKLKRVKVHKTLPMKYLNQLSNYKAYSSYDLYCQIYLFASLGGKVKIPLRALITLRKKDIKAKFNGTNSVRQFEYKGNLRFKDVHTCTITPEMETILKDIEANHELHDDYVFPIATQDRYTEDEWVALYNKERYRYKKSVEVFNKFYKHVPCKKERIELLKTKRFYESAPKRAVLFFFFSHFAQGINLIDMAKLKYHNIQTILDDDGKLVKYIQYKRTKTGHEITFPITEQLQEILDFFEENDDAFPRVEGYLLPIVKKDYKINDQSIYGRVHTVRVNVNENLQRIAHQLNWPETLHDISMYWARHSYAQRCLIAGANKEYIQSTLGHKELSTTENYLEGFEVLNMHEFNQDLFKDDAKAV